jgi:hypothetical protein
MAMPVLFLVSCTGDPSRLGERQDAVYIADLQTLLPGERIGNDGSGESTRWLVNNGFILIMQEDCNLVLYDSLDSNWCAIADDARWAVLWESNTDGKAARDTCYVEMQTDGNLVIYRHDTGAAIWDTSTEWSDGAWLTLQSDGNLVSYIGAAVPANKVWSTNTWRRNPGGAMRECGGGPQPTTGNLTATVKGVVATIVGCANVPVYFTLDPDTGSARTQSTTGSSTSDLPPEPGVDVCRWTTTFWGVPNGGHDVRAVIPTGPTTTGHGEVQGGLNTTVQLQP